jgi:hypothetical protein
MRDPSLVRTKVVHICPVIGIGSILLWGGIGILCLTVPFANNSIVPPIISVLCINGSPSMVKLLIASAASPLSSFVFLCIFPSHASNPISNSLAVASQSKRLTYMKLSTGLPSPSPCSIKCDETKELATADKTNESPLEVVNLRKGASLVFSINVRWSQIFVSTLFVLYSMATYAVREASGRLRGSLAAICLSVCLACHPSLAANTTATTISMKIPNISIFQPRSALLLCSRKASISRNKSSIGGPSSQSPQNTRTPPKPAAIQAKDSQNHQDAEGEERMVKIIYFSISQVSSLFMLSWLWISYWRRTESSDRSISPVARPWREGSRARRPSLS